jgi:hypothetical protein
VASCTIPYDLEPTYDRWSGLNLANRRTLIREDHPRRHLLRTIGSKLERLPAHGESNLTSFVACDLHDAEAIVECEPGRRCRRPNFCGLCSWIRYQDVFSALAPAIEATPERFFELTISWNRPFPLSTGFDFDPLLAAWDLQVVLIEQAIRDRLFSGGVFCKQVERLSFLPLSGLPHVHGVILADDGLKLGEDLHGLLVDSSAWKVFLKLFRRILPEGLQPDIRIEPLGTSASVYRFLGYSMWPFWPAQGPAEDSHRSPRAVRRAWGSLRAPTIP